MNRPDSKPAAPPTSPSPVEALERGRASFERHAWGDAFAQLSAADHLAPLQPADLERLANAAKLIGKDAESAECWKRAHQAYVAMDDPASATRCAFWIAFTLQLQGEGAQAGGWLARGQRLLDDSGRDCVERGYLMLPGAVQCARSGGFDAGYDAFVRIAEIARRFHDPSLMTFALHGQGRTLIGRGELDRGVALLDEAMIAVTAGEVAPIVVGGIYCSLIEACHAIFDLRRADEWTTALTQWSASQPDLVTFRGECMVHRTQILELRGAWTEALDEARGACDRLSRPSPQRAVGEAWYRLAELLRLRGDYAEAEEAYRQASAFRKPQPGLALLRLAQGNVEAAHATIQRVMDETASEPGRCAVLPAFVSIALAANDVAAARAAATELSAIADRLDAPFLIAVAAHAAGTVSLAEGDARAALASLRKAWALWRDLEAPYEAARTGVRIAFACRSLGDDDTANLEREAARRVFERLGAAPDLSSLEQPSGAPAAVSAGPLTAREVEVLRLVASGKTNRAIADALFISDKTVARHISNIFNKLDLPSRAAATAYAYRHKLV